MMALNRYRLKHLAENQHRSAMLAKSLLDKPDRLIGLILLGNNLVNIFAASITTLIAMRLWGEAGLAIAPVILTVVILIFAEVAPKTFAAMHPERLAFPAAYILKFLLWILYPVVWLVNLITNNLLKYLGINTDDPEDVPLNREELRTVVHEAGTLIPRRHQRMLLSILDLENVTVDDIMVPRSEIVGIDLDDSFSDILEQLNHCQHTRLPLYSGNLDDIVGLIHVRRLFRILNDSDEPDNEDLKKTAREPYFVPEGTPLHTQLVNFQRAKKRIGLVVDEYGVILGLVTLEDILEEIVGDFTTDMQHFNQDIHVQEDGSFVIDGSTPIRDINRQLKWQLPTEGPKTLNGLILEQLEDIPESGTSMKIGEYTIEIIQAADNAVRTARLTQLHNKTASQADEA